MTTGQRIRAVRKEQGLTQKELGELLGVSASAVGQFETNKKPPKIETLDRIAVALQVPITYLIGEVKQVPADMALDQKLSHIGYSIGYYEEDSIMWINYPDGTLDVSVADLEELNTRANEYLRFLLHELREKHWNDFRTTPQKEVNHGND